MLKYFLVIILFISSCRKNEAAKTQNLYLATCTSKTVSGEKITVCFNSLNDSRCPSDLVCVWSGVGIAKFTLIKKGVSYPFTLTTLPVFHPYSSDTVVAGYKFHLVNILPYPKSSSPVSPGDIYAILDIF